MDKFFLCAFKLPSLYHSELSFKAFDTWSVFQWSYFVIQQNTWVLQSITRFLEKAALVCIFSSGPLFSFVTRKACVIDAFI